MDTILQFLDKHELHDDQLENHNKETISNIVKIVSGNYFDNNFDNSDNSIIVL